MSMVNHIKALLTAMLLAASSNQPTICNAYPISSPSSSAKSISHLDLQPISAAKSPIEPPSKSTAAILNANARSVSAPLAELAREVLGPSNVHVTETAAEARSAAASVIAGNYSLVVPVGGDGTLSAWIDSLVGEIMERRDGDAESVEEAVGRLPVIGYVPRGTGNGLGHVVGCWDVDDARIAADARDTNKEAGAGKKSLLSKINPLSRRKQRQSEKTKRVLLRLKEVGDLLQRMNNANDAQQVADLKKSMMEKCTLVEMPMMQVIHYDHDDEDGAPPTTSTTTTSSSTNNKKGDLCFFAGSGFDSLMLHDFQQIKAWSSTSKTLPTFLKDALSSVAGYCVALVTLTLPQTLRYGTHKIRVKVTTVDDETLWVDHRRGDFSELAVRAEERGNGNVNENANEDTANGLPNNNVNATTAKTQPNPQKKQHLLYSGTTGILAASTTPYYGGGLRLFPYARLIPNKLQLRLGRISPLVGFLNIPSIFRGSYREKSDRFGCLDFIGDDFEVEVGSDAYREHVERKRRGGGWWWRRIRGRTDSVAGEDSNGEQKMMVSSKKGFPFQHSGESMGIKERFRLRVVKTPVRFVSFLRPRVVVDE